MSIAEFVRILGRGPGRSRSLTEDEAREAMERVLAGQAAPEATGAMLMLMRMKGETAEELAGFAKALRDKTRAVPRADLDWPSYAAGRTRGLPLFLLSARLVAMAGHTVLLHGWNGLSETGPFVRAGLPLAGIASCNTVNAAETALATDGIAYLPLEIFAPELLGLLKLRADFGLRSCLNTVARMLNPGGAAASVQGVFHPPYLELQMDASALLGLQQMSVIKGGGGEFERNPSKEIRCFGLREGVRFDRHLPVLSQETRRLGDGERDLEKLAQIWDGRLDAPFASSVIVGTAALALETLGHAQAEQMAQSLWEKRLS